MSALLCLRGDFSAQRVKACTAANLGKFDEGQFDNFFFRFNCLLNDLVHVIPPSAT